MPTVTVEVADLAATARNYANAEAASTVRGDSPDPTVTAAIAGLPDPSYVDAATFVDLTPLVDRLPEGTDIATVCNALGEHLAAVARAHRGLGRACSQLAAHIDHAHSRVEHELR